MTEWYEFHAKISELRRGLKEKPVEHSLDLMLSLLSQIVSRAELQGLESDQNSIHKSLDELRMNTLTARIEALEADAQRDRRRIEKHLQAISNTLDTIGKRLPEPPQGFDG
jgi:DNA-binding HxlR family transcriptional regulator